VEVLNSEIRLGQLVFVLEQKFQDGHEPLLVRFVLRITEFVTFHQKKRRKKMAFGNGVGSNGVQQAVMTE